MSAIKKYILINYVYNYDKKYLWVYSLKVLEELDKRNVTIKQFNHFDRYFADVACAHTGLRYTEHDDEYLTICYYNLREKYLRGQKDFTNELMRNLNAFMFHHDEELFTFKKEDLNNV